MRPRLAIHGEDAAAQKRPELLEPQLANLKVGKACDEQGVDVGRLGGDDHARAEETAPAARVACFAETRGDDVVEEILAAGGHADDAPDDVDAEREGVRGLAGGLAAVGAGEGAEGAFAAEVAEEGVDGKESESEGDDWRGYDGHVWGVSRISQFLEWWDCERSGGHWRWAGCALFNFVLARAVLLLVICA